MGTRKDIFSAAVSGDLEATRKYLDQGAEINALDKDGNSALALAVGNGHTAIVEYLIVKGADVDLADRKNLTPIEIACVNGQPEAAKILLAHGCDIHDSDNQAIHFAAAFGQFEILTALLEKGADVNKLDEGNRTPLHWAAQESHCEIARQLIDHGAVLDILDDVGLSPLGIATIIGNVEMIELLLRHGASADLAEAATPFDFACSKKNIAVASILAKYGADVNHADDHGRTPLFYATLHDERSLIAFLMENGARSDIVDRFGIPISALSDSSFRKRMIRKDKWRSIIQPSFPARLSKDWKTFFTPDSDDWYKDQHPVAYGILVIVGLTAMFGPTTYYVAFMSSRNWPGNQLVSIIGLIGSFVFGIGLFNFVAAFLKQYMGHVFAVVTVGGGLLLSMLAIAFNLS